tara:strand:+ start:964 stop:1173 length:210 start_codon:yes stop_codon:yes gene_type:complete
LSQGKNINHEVESCFFDGSRYICQFVSIGEEDSLWDLHTVHHTLAIFYIETWQVDKALSELITIVNFLH